jgi:hypothetical protein
MNGGFWSQVSSKQLFAAKEQLISKTPVSYNHQLDLVASHALAAVPS